MIVKVLLTLGRTKSYLDPVRYLSNNSSGKLGLSLLEALQQSDSKFQVDTIAGETNVKLTPTYSAHTNQDMAYLLQTKLKNYECLIMCAAPCDFVIKNYSPAKIVKKNLTNEFSLTFMKDMNIIESLIPYKKKQQVWIGFSCQNDLNPKTAYDKLVQAQFDSIIVNSIDTINQDQTEVIIINRDQSQHHVQKNSKKKVAQKIIKYVTTKYK